MGWSGVRERVGVGGDKEVHQPLGCICSTLGRGRRGFRK